MEKKLSYSKPFMAMEQFVPQEFVAACIPVGAGFHVDFYNTIGTYGIYDGPNNERVDKAWGPAVLDDYPKQSFTVDIYRWCKRTKPTYWGDKPWDELWTAATCNHSYSNGGPTSGGNSFSYYDGHDGGGWNFPNGHFVKMAEGVTLTVSASGNKATIHGGTVLNGFQATNAS